MPLAALVVSALCGLTSVGCGHHSAEPPTTATMAPERAADDPAGERGADGMPRGYGRPVPLASRTEESGDPLDGGARTSTNGLANPGPTANPCTRDDECITHRCNPAFHRCAFPCVSDRDCIAGNYCYTSVVAVCLPRGDGAGGVDGG